LTLNLKVPITAAAPAYYAEFDAPALVAFACADPLENTKYLKQYISFHRTNGHVLFNNRSLGVIAEWVLRVPNLE